MQSRCCISHFTKQQPVERYWSRDSEFLSGVVGHKHSIRPKESLGASITPSSCPLSTRTKSRSTGLMCPCTFSFQRLMIDRVSHHVLEHLLCNSWIIPPSPGHF